MWVKHQDMQIYSYTITSTLPLHYDSLTSHHTLFLLFHPRKHFLYFFNSSISLSSSCYHQSHTPLRTIPLQLRPLCATQQIQSRLKREVQKQEGEYLNDTRLLLFFLHYYVHAIVPAPLTSLGNSQLSLQQPVLLRSTPS